MKIHTLLENPSKSLVMAMTEVLTIVASIWAMRREMKILSSLDKTPLRLVSTHAMVITWSLHPFKYTSYGISSPESPFSIVFSVPAPFKSTSLGISRESSFSTVLSVPTELFDPPRLWRRISSFEVFRCAMTNKPTNNCASRGLRS